MTQPKHTHPLGYLQQTAKQLKDYWFFILLALWQWGNLSAFWRLIMVLALVAWLLVWPLLQWLTLTYLIEPTAVVVNSGIFIRHHQHIPYSRIQTVQRKQWFYLRPFHLEALQIETASYQDDEPEVRLPAVPTTVADTLNAYRFDLPLTTDSVPATAQATPETAASNLPDIRQRYVTNPTAWSCSP